MERLEVEGSFSVAEGGSRDRERKAGHWSDRKVLTKEEEQEVEGTEKRGTGNWRWTRQSVGCSPRAMELVAALQCAKSKNSKQHVSIPRLNEKSDTCKIRRNARPRACESGIQSGRSR